jgi:hypothetical protein
MKKYNEMELENARSVPDIFELVKKAVKRTLNLDHAGLMLGMSDLGMRKDAFIGAFYSLNSNMIIINKSPLNLVKQHNPDMYTHYLFHILLHEYLHSTGFYDEYECRKMTVLVSQESFGKEHPLAKFSLDSESLFGIGYGKIDEHQEQDLDIEFVLGFDKSNLSYIG